MDIESFLSTQNWLQRIDDEQLQILYSTLHIKKLLTDGYCSFIYEKKVMTFLTIDSNNITSQTIYRNQLSLDILISEPTSICPAALFFIINYQNYLIQHPKIANISHSKSQGVTFDFPFIEMKIACTTSALGNDTHSSFMILSTVLKTMEQKLTGILLKHDTLNKPKQYELLSTAEYLDKMAKLTTECYQAMQPRLTLQEKRQLALIHTNITQQHDSDMKTYESNRLHEAVDIASPYNYSVMFANDIDFPIQRNIQMTAVHEENIKTTIEKLFQTQQDTMTDSKMELLEMLKVEMSSLSELISEQILLQSIQHSNHTT